MTCHPFHKLSTIRVAKLGLSGLISVGLVISPSIAETQVSSAQASSAQANPESPRRQGLPGRRIGGGTRPGEQSTYSEYKPLVALMPQSNLGITTAAHPTLLFHLPIFQDNQRVEFVIYDSKDDLVLDKIFSVSGRSGIVGIDLSKIEDLAPLAINETYKWYFLIVDDNRSQDIAVDGWIQRVDLDTWLQEQNIDSDFTHRLQTATPLQQVRLLGQEAGLWLDAALVLHQLRQANPNNVAAMMEWESLLQSIGFSNMGEEPVAELSIVSVPNEYDHLAP